MKILYYSFITFLVGVGVALGQGKENKGKFFVYWGWNHAQFGKSDIRFVGKDYDFTLDRVAAHDRQTTFSLKYFNPGKMTIPQYNFRLGYFYHDNWNVSFGIDHMKYVMDQDQIVNMNGNIHNGSAFDGDYHHVSKKLTKDFLTFEHTDGLNYANIELRRFDNLVYFPILKNKKGIDVNLTEGIGAGILYPKTNTQLMGQERYDEFHLAGFGTGLMVGINFTFWDYFFIQTEIKGGYIRMNDIRTTADKSDKAKQSIWYSQQNIVFGAIIPVFN
ncbi:MULTISPECIES: hypothetical protein [Weeksella]|uniref:Uncharacterized protein n=1 Tax=Weeksella virosa (strain ATCC 43766 / DSM 16922 / JCM 21250 / CCUG 30538 / CDC 9751 / IAM 14551 / NBRC 16016 / NCTC 11634 / CL345/78) TaxID=865938 RepID=F0NYX8_WEEVC|nr:MULTISPECIES: hypothetical protein [Weeksella]ADX67180.1 hypothetical protein Weevi_0461 [Weeksella virosa DSM 16922]SUP53451.1 Uncharacterised protein [Weeksella virosa]VEH63083.1 Uncharacterised protein [Weeksella virosa]